MPTFKITTRFLFLLVSGLILLPGSSLLGQEGVGDCRGSGDPQDVCNQPIPMGVSASLINSAPFIYTGTAGMRVRSFFDPNDKFILSNNHVMGAVGPTLCPNTAPIGTEAIQPGSLDLGFDPGPGSPFQVGNLANFIPIDFTAGANNFVDAAIVSTTSAQADTEQLGSGSPTTAFLFPAPGMEVTKMGRTTGETFGVIQSINNTSNVNYGSDCGTARFRFQVSITPGNFSDGGDSGSVIREVNSNTPVALLFAGSAASTLANHLLLVYLQLQVIVDTPDAPTSLAELAAAVRNSPLDPRLVPLMRIQARAEDQVLSIPGVVGIGIGLSEDGQDYAFVVYRERPDRQRDRLIPRDLEGVPVRLIDNQGEFVAF